MKINSNQKYIDYIFIVLLLLNGGTIIKVLGYTAILQFITAFIMLLCLLINGRLFIKKTRITILVLVFGLLLMNSFHYSIFDYDAFLSNQIINFIVLICIGVFVSNQFLNRTNFFIFRLNGVLKILLIHGVLSCLMVSLFPTKNAIFMALDERSAYVGYFNIFFQRSHILYTGYLDETMQTVLGFNFFRAHGLFWESGVFSTFVNIYVFINFFILKNLKSLKYSIPALVLSWSTAGFLVFTVQAVIFFKDYKRGKKGILFKKYLFGGLGFIFLIFIAFQNFNNKIYGDDAGSAAQRYADTLGAISIITNNPLFGIGVEFQNIKSQFQNYTVDFHNSIGANFESLNKDDIKLSNSFLRVFVYFGIPLGLFLIYTMYNQSLIPYKRWLFFLITVLSVFSSPILFLGFHFSFIISGLRQSIPVLRYNNKKK
jgi:hypothetical protein